MWYMGHNGKYKEQEEEWLLWLPENLRLPMLNLAHRGGRANIHPKFERMISTLTARFWWQNNRQHIKDYTAGCALCKRTSTPLRSGKGFMGEYPFTEDSFQVIHVDHVGPLPETKEGFNYVLTAIDRATNYCWAIPVKTATAAETCKELWDRVFCQTGVPRRIISDRGTAFKNAVVEEMARFTGLKWNYYYIL